MLNKQQMHSLGSTCLPNHYNFLLDFIATLHHATAEIQKLPVIVFHRCLLSSLSLPVRLISVMTQVTVCFDKLLSFVRI